MECIFCKIVKGEEVAHKIWEDEKHLAFLSIFPNTEGFSVVITKEHYPSYVFDLPKDVLIELVKAAKKVAKLLDKKFDDVGRTGMILEGFGVDHAHAKLFRCMEQKILNGNQSHQKLINILKNTKDIFPHMITSELMTKDCLGSLKKSVSEFLEKEKRPDC